MESVDLRRSLANIGLVVFVLSTSTGFALLAPWAGFVAFGITSGVAAFLLGTTTEEPG